MRSLSIYCRCISFAARIAFVLLAAAATNAKAQSATGTITGRIYNPTTNEYVQYARVSVQGTSITTVSGADGGYRLLNVPTGAATVVVEYTGSEVPPATVKVVAGQAVTQDFNLSPPAASEKEGVVRLEAFNVSAEREGNAKAIMDQKHAMTVSNIVSAETFGNVAEGNVGEFVKYLPGIQVDYVEADARSPRIRGLPAQYTTVTMNGMKLASADGFIQNNGTDNGGGGGAGDRSFGFEQVSLSSVDAVEINFTTNASQDADAPAGNINLIPRHAYERSGQSINFSVSAMGNSEQLYLHKSIGPDDSKNRKILPNASFSYSNSFFHRRLGVTVSLDESNSYNEQRQFQPNYDSGTAANPLPPVLTRIQYKDGPKFSERSTASFTVDYKVTDNLSLSLIGILSNYAAFVGNRSFGITTNRANLGPTNNGFDSWNNVAITGLTNSYAYLNKRTHGFNYLPSFEYKRGPLELSGALAYSQSVNNYAGGESKSLPGINVGGVSIPTSAIRVNATRGADPYTWSVRQVAGPDWAQQSNYVASATGTPTVSVDGRYVNDLIYQGRLDAKYTTSWRLPTWFQIGGKTTETTWIYRNPTAWQTWSYIGPGGGKGGNWNLFPGAFQFDPGHGSSLLSTSGGTAAIPNHNAIGYLFKQHPEYFVPNGTAANYLTAFVQQPKYVREQVDALYGMGDVKPLRPLELQGGLRWERTRDEIKDLNPLSSSQVQAAGFPVTSAGVASTIPGIQYQYFSRPRAARSANYNKIFPSASLKYEFTPHLQGLLGYSYTVTRPSYGDLSGAYTVDDTNMTIKLPNTYLKPEYANNYSARLTYYFEPVGDFGIGVFQNDFKNYQQQVTSLGTASQFGFTDPIYDSYEVTTKQNIPGTVEYRGLTLEYTESLSFLPRPFNGFNVFANYTRLYYLVKLPDPSGLHSATPYNYGWLPGISPNTINYGISYHYNRITVGFKAQWTDRMGYTGTYNEWQKPRTKVDIDASYRLTANLTVFFYARNIFNVPDYDYVGTDSRHITSNGRGIEYYGAYLYSGIKGSF